MTLPAPIAALQTSSVYPQRPPEVTLVQTHISYVFLAGDAVYKVKKAVRFSFLDFSTLERRRYFCHEEVRLNRRLAPHVYHGVVSICPRDHGYRLGTADDPAAVEYAVHMRRLRKERILATLLDAHAVTERDIEDIAIHMARFHRTAAHGPEVTANGAPEAIGRVLADNFAGARPFRDVTIPARDDDAIQDFCNGFLRRETTLLERRQAEERIRDCHGDLHAEHISLDAPLVVFDCIEFNPLFRYCDVASEMAFLAMDLDYRGYPDLSRHLVDRYTREAGDAELRRLLPFYQCYRAYVRGKVDSLKSAEAEVEESEREAARDSARRHFALAYRYLWADRPRLVVVFGLSGSGKSTVAAGLCARIGFVHVNSDVVRKQLAGLPPTARGGSELYTSEQSARTYRTMLARAKEAVGAGQGVIIDATFQRRIHRDAVRELASEIGVPLLFVDCHCAEDVIRERLRSRVARSGESSDADWSVYLAQRASYETWASDEGDNRVIVDTSMPAPVVTATIEEALRAVGIVPPRGAPS